MGERDCDFLRTFEMFERPDDYKSVFRPGCCGKPHASLGLCNNHAKQFRNNPKRFAKKDPGAFARAQRLQGKVDHADYGRRQQAAAETRKRKAGAAAGVAAAAAAGGGGAGSKKAKKAKKKKKKKSAGTAAIKFSASNTRGGGNFFGGRGRRGRRRR